MRQRTYFKSLGEKARVGIIKKKIQAFLNCLTFFPFYLFIYRWLGKLSRLCAQDEISSVWSKACHKVEN